MKFFDLLENEKAKELDTLLEDENQPTILTKLNEPETVLKVMRSGLWYSYLFNRFTIPMFASHVFQSLIYFPPVNDENGPLLAGVAGAIKGELFNNNIYGGNRCHSHYIDMAEAYNTASGDIEYLKELPEKIEAADKKTIRGAYAVDLIELLKNPIATFILVPAIEKGTPKFFETVSKNLSKESRFDKYRQFVDRHIELDRGEHSSVTMDWLAYVAENLEPNDSLTETEMVINLLKLSRGKT